MDKYKDEASSFLKRNRWYIVGGVAGLIVLLAFITGIVGT